MSIQKVLVAPIWQDLVDGGSKYATTRLGERPYHIGLCHLYCDITGWEKDVMIRRITICRLSDLTIQQLRASGFYDKRDAVKCLKVYYPEVTIQSVVTHINWGTATLI